MLAGQVRGRVHRPIAIFTIRASTKEKTILSSICSTVHLGNLAEYRAHDHISIGIIEEIGRHFESASLHGIISTVEYARS
jgi:hypothetical protein